MNIGNIIWEPSIGSTDNLAFETNKTDDSIDNNFYTIRFAQYYKNTSLSIADLQTGNGMNTANVRWQNKDAYAIEVQLDEEKSKDNEIKRCTKQLDIWCFSIVKMICQNKQKPGCHLRSIPAFYFLWVVKCDL